jgi:hypothetical protein
MPRIAVRIAAEDAQIAVADVVADTAEAQLVVDIQQGLGELFGVVARGA